MSFKNLCKGLLLSVATFGISGGAVSAANGDIDREDRIVYITGDQWDDNCQVYVDGDEIEIELFVYDENGELDDTDTKDYDLDDIDLIIFQGFDGDDDFWNSTPVPSRAFGGDGNDVLLGGWSNDDLYGGDGNDFLAGRDGDDDLFGDADADWLYGGEHNDYLKAGNGEDEYVIAGQNGADRFATPATFSWWSRTWVPIDRNVFWEDFDPQEDTEFYFWAPMTFTPVQRVNLITP